MEGLGVLIFAHCPRQAIRKRVAFGLVLFPNIQEG